MGRRATGNHIAGYYVPDISHGQRANVGEKLGIENISSDSKTSLRPPCDYIAVSVKCPDRFVSNLKSGTRSYIFLCTQDYLLNHAYEKLFSRDL